MSGLRLEKDASAWGRDHSDANIPSGDTEAAIDFLDRWYGDERRVIITIHPETKATVRRDFAPEESARMHAFIDIAQGRLNVYTVVNVAGPGGTSPKKAEMRAARAFHIDADLKDMGGDAEAVLGRLRSFDPPPSIINFSGGGYWALWLLDTPYEDDDWRERIEKICEGLHKAAGANPTCRTINRLMRLPGTVNMLDATKRAQGRLPALSYVVEANWDRRWSFARDPVPTLPKEEAEGPYALPEKVLKAIETGDPKLLKKKDATRSDVVWFVACTLVRAGWDDEHIAALLLDPEKRISEHVREQDDPADYALKQAREAREKVGLQVGFACGNDGKIIANHQENIRTALARLGVTVRRDLFADRTVLAGLDGFGPYLEDAALNRMYLRIETEFGFRGSFAFFEKVVLDQARQNGFHPVKEYLDDLRWDGVPRIDSWLFDYAKAIVDGFGDAAKQRREKLISAVGRITLVAAVRRIRQPGCKFDEVLTFISDQGLNKSTALSTLAVRPEWFTDSLNVAAQDKEAIEQLAGKWIAELSELKGMKGRTEERVKAFTSRLADRARVAYGRIPIDVPRHTVFFGSTNNPTFLTDVSGNRRWWPVKVAGFDIEALARDRDQLWAEAAAAEASGESIRLDPALYDAAQEVQSEHREGEQWTAELAATLGDLVGKVTTADLYKVLNIPVERQDATKNARLNAAMRDLGWEPKQARFGRGVLERGHAKGTEDERSKIICIERDPDSQVLSIYYEGSRPRYDDDRPFI